MEEHRALPLVGKLTHMALTRKIAASLCGAAIALGVLATAPAATAAPASTVTPTAVASYTTAQNKFVRYVRAEEPSLVNLSKYKTVDLGKMTCKGLKGGLSGMDVIEVYVESGFTDDQTVALISGAVLYLCPGQAYKFN